jgi:FkbM family methyltransferase
VGPLLRFPGKMQLLWLVATRCGRGIDRWKLLISGFVLYLCDLLPIQPTFKVRLHWDELAKPIFIRSFGDFSTIKEIFIDQVYDLPIGVQPRTIIDLGSNIGLAMCYFSLRFPGVVIWGYEPDPSNWRQLERNSSALERVQTFPLAVSGQRGQALFSADSHRGTSSGLTSELGDGAIVVEACTLDEVIEKTGIETIDLVKFDIEGAEYDVFQSFNGWGRVQVFVGEVHQTEKTDLLGAFCDRFEEHGYSVQTEGNPETGVLHLLAFRQSE